MARSFVHNEHAISKAFGSSLRSKLASWVHSGEPLLHPCMLQGFANRLRLDASVENKLFVFGRQCFGVWSGTDF